MVTVEFTAVGPGRCRWCQADKDEVVELAFADGSFAGRYCFGDFKNALRDRLGDPPPVPRPPAAGE
jgi:hypothetical protein